jgi:hypothetical protein
MSLHMHRTLDSRLPRSCHPSHDVSQRAAKHFSPHHFRRRTCNRHRPIELQHRRLQFAECIGARRTIFQFIAQHLQCAIHPHALFTVQYSDNFMQMTFKNCGWGSDVSSSALVAVNSSVSIVRCVFVNMTATSGATDDMHHQSA